MKNLLHNVNSRFSNNPDNFLDKDFNKIYEARITLVGRT